MASKKKNDETGTAKAPTIKSVRKLSVKTIRGNKKIIARNLPEDGSAMPLCRIAGTVHGEKKGETDFGAWRAFTGSFVAVSRESGETFKAPRVLLPSQLDEEIGAVFAEAGGQPFEIKVDIAVQIDDESSVGYIFVCENLLQGGGLSEEDLAAKLDD